MFDLFNKKEKSPSGGGKTNNEAITSIIGADMKITGDISSATSIRVDGAISGNVHAEKLIVIGEKADVKGDLSSKKIIIFGKLQGNINAGEIQLKATGVINGDISVQTVEIEIGGKYNGKLMMNTEQQEQNEKLKLNTIKTPLTQANH